MSTATDQTIAAYKAVQERLSTPNRRVTLVGSAGYARACPQCCNQVYKGAPLINAGKINGRWRWICIACASTDPTQLPHVQDLMHQAVTTPGDPLLKKFFWQELDQLADELGFENGKDLINKTTLIKMKQAQPPELEGCQPVVLGEVGLGVMAPNGKEEIAQEWVQKANQAALDELAAMVGMPLKLAAPPVHHDVILEVLKDMGITPAADTRGAPLHKEHACLSAACMDQHLQIMQNNFDSPSVAGPMINQLRADLSSVNDPADYYWNAGLALREGIKYFVDPVASRAITKSARQLRGSVPLTADLFPAPAGFCWLAEPNKQLTPGETVRAISWTLTQAVYLDAYRWSVLVPTVPGELSGSNASGVWVQLWLYSKDYESVFGVFPLPRTTLWHGFAAADLRGAGPQAAAELSWLAAFLRGYEEGDHGVL